MQRQSNTYLLNEHFNSFKDGNVEELQEIFDLERDPLFDYIARMTGDLNSAPESLEASYKYLEGRHKNYNTYKELRAAMFLSTRKIAQPGWAETTRNRLMPVTKMKNRRFRDTKSANGCQISQQDFQTIEEKLSELEPNDREVLLLVLKEGFTFTEAGTIMGLEQKKVMSTFYPALKKLKETSGELSKQATDILKLLPNYIAPPRSALHTVNLSILVKDLKGSRFSSWRFPSLLVLLFFLVLAAVFYYLYPKYFVEYGLKLKQHLNNIWHFLM